MGALKNIVGNRYGLLTVVKRHGKNTSNHVTWTCLCECGNTSIHTGNNLRSGHAKSCGCLKSKPSSNSIDLVGDTFGRLTVISKHEVQGGVCFWDCVCSCGTITKVCTGHLRSGHTKSCGCLSSEVSRKLAYKNLAGKKKIARNGSLPNRVTSGGYIRCHDKHHPRSDKSGFVLEHIVVMEKVLGRSLFPSENVHHKNGDRSDNSQENLELWDRSQPPGQRVEDKLKFYVGFIASHDEDDFELGCDIETLKKAAWYLTREISRLEKSK